MIINKINIKEIRKELGLTQSQLANELDVALRTVQKWESGETKIRKSNAFMIKSLYDSRNKGVTESLEKGLIKDGTEIAIQEIVTFIIENEDIMKQNKTFKLFIDREVERAENKSLKEFIKKND